MRTDVYERELLRLQTELVKMQEWVRQEGQRVMVLFEGRDAAGKGGTIKRISEYLNPRWCRLGGAPGSHGQATQRVVLPTLCRAAAGRRRDSPVRSQLVQPRRCGAGDGFLHGSRRGTLLPAVPRVRAHAARRRHRTREVLVLCLRRGA